MRFIKQNNKNMRNQAHTNLEGVSENPKVSTTSRSGTDSDDSFSVLRQAAKSLTLTLASYLAEFVAETVHCGSMSFVCINLHKISMRWL